MGDPIDFDNPTAVRDLIRALERGMDTAGGRPNDGMINVADAVTWLEQQARNSTGDTRAFYQSAIGVIQNRSDPNRDGNVARQTNAQIDEMVAQSFANQPPRGGRGGGRQ